MEDPKPRRGRKPRKIDPAEVTRLIGRGATRAQVAAAFGITPRTLYNRLRDEPELQAAVEAGRQRVPDVGVSALISKAEAGDWRAIRLLTLRNLGWLESGFGTRGSKGLNRVLMDSWSRL